MAQTTNVFEADVANLVFRTTPCSLWHVVEADENTATVVCVDNGGNPKNDGKTKVVPKDHVFGAFRLVDGEWTPTSQNARERWTCTGLPNSF